MSKPRGRPPKPIQEKYLAGDPGNRLSADAKSALEAGQHPVQNVTPLTMPPMSKPAQAIWREVVQSQLSGVYGNTDKFQIAAYCEAVAKFQMASARLAKGEWTTEGSMGQVTASPFVAMQKDAIAQINLLGPSLFLTPVARQTMRSATSDKPTLGSLTGGLIQ